MNATGADSILLVVGGAEDVDQLASSVFDVVATNAFNTGNTHHLIAEGNIDCSCHYAGILGQGISLVAGSTGSCCHVAGLAEGIQLLAFATLVQEESIGAGYAVGALRGNAVRVSIFIGDLRTNQTFANIDRVTVIAAITFVLGRGVGFAERIFAEAGELG